MTTASLTFVGNATTILRLGRFTLLTDPNFITKGQNAYLGKGLWTRRLQDPALNIPELPPLTAVLLSHLHGDHFDRVARRGLDPAVPVVTTAAAARRLHRWGFATHELHTWERQVLRDGDENLVIEALPGIHGRGVMGPLLPPVMGSLVEHWVDGEVVRRVMFSGDTLTGDHLDEIHRRHPDIDVAVVHLGGTRVLLNTVTMDAAQGLDYLRRTRPRRVVPVHFDDYRAFRSSLSDFLDEVQHAGLRDSVTVVPRGHEIDL